MSDRSHDAQSPAPSRRWILLLLCALLLAAFELRLLLFTGLQRSDDPGYVLDAFDLVHGALALPDYVNGLRILTLLPLGLCLRLLGVTPLSIALYPLLSSVLLVLAAWLLGRRLFGLAGGLIAATLAVFHPLDINLATWMLPDVPMALFSALAVLALLRSRRKRTIAPAVVAGLLLGACWLVKESGLICFVIPPAFAAAEWIGDRPRGGDLRRIFGRAAVALAAALGVVALEAAVYRVVAGSWGYRFEILRSFYNAPGAAERFELVRDLGFYPKVMFLWAVDYAHPDTRFYGYFFFAAAAGLVVALRRRRFPELLPAAWFLAVFLFAQFGSSRLTEYVPFHRLPRHLEMLTVPAVLLSTLLLLALGRRTRIGAVALGLFLCIDGGLAAAGRHLYLRNETADIRAALERLDVLPYKPVFTDFMTVEQLDVLTGLAQKGRFLPAEGAAPETVQDAWVLLDAHRGWVEGAAAIRDLPPWFRNPPPNWKRIAEIHASSGGIYDTWNPTIWYAPPRWFETAPAKPSGDDEP